MGWRRTEFEPLLSDTTLKIRRNLLFACAGGLIIKTYDLKLFKWLVDASAQEARSIFAVFIFYLFFEWLNYALPESYPHLNGEIRIKKLVKIRDDSREPTPSAQLAEAAHADLTPEDREIEQGMKDADNRAVEWNNRKIIFFDIGFPTLFGLIMCIYFMSDLKAFISSVFKALFS